MVSIIVSDREGLDMGLFGLFKRSDIDAGVEKFKKTPGAVLIDVRNEDEYKKGHIPDSINITDKEIEKVEAIVENRDAAIYLYCLSGARSWNAEKKLKNMGYKNAKRIGGINQYSGPMV